jgi:hypothetical protein
VKLVARILMIAAGFVVSVAVSAAVLAYFNQQRIVVAVLTSIKNQTGVAITAPSSKIHVRDHLIVELEHPQWMSANGGVATAERIRAVVNFRSIFTYGLPLRELDFERLSVTSPFNANSVGSSALPRLDRELIEQTVARLGDMAHISRRLVVTDLDLRDASGALLLHHAHLSAYHRHATPKLWSIGFTTECDLPKISGAHAAGDFTVGEGGALASAQVLHGTFWLWQLPLKHLTIGNLEVDGQSQGQVTFSLAHDTSVDGVAAIGLNALIVRSPDLSKPLDLGNYNLEARFTTSTERLSISNARLTHDGKPVMTAQGSIQKPFEPNPQVAVRIGELNLVWKDLLASVRTLKRAPQELEVLVRQVRSGRIEVEKASVDSSLLALQNFSLDSVLAKLSVNATLTELSFATPSKMQLPDVTGASAQIVFSKRTLSLLQGSAKIGNSELHDIEAQIDLSKSLAAVPYQISMNGDLDLAQLRPATMKVLDQLNVHERDRLQAVQGAVAVDLDASGTLRKDSPTRPEKYSMKVEPRSVSIGFRGAPGPIGVASGAIIVQPNTIRLEKVSARATGGTADFNGELRIGDDGVQTRGLRIDMHQMPIERWLEGLVDPDDFSATGNVGGEIVVTGDRQHGFLANGKVTLLNGRVQFGFLRSPILVHPAILTIRDRTLVVSMPAAELEKAPIDFNVTVPDLRTPSIRIDANVQKLDIEVLKFVRLPWTPPTPTHPPQIPISGHIDAREANLETFAMKNAKTDFKYRDGDWSVDNLSATALGGHLNLHLVGRKKDDWIHIIGRALNQNAASLFLLNRKVTRSPISGRIDLTADLWADTNADFFSTMAGTAILKARDGNLDKFTLLSRLLELIDLRSWITANVPDPRVSGIQFRTASADFKGRDGVFYTDDLLLDGPAIDIVASGNVNIDRSTLDMKIGMIPFNTVSWVLSSIPLVGKNVGGSTKSIISAYFNVRGPIADPSVTPAPITSVAELLKKTLGLPINLIRPDTIK